MERSRQQGPTEMEGKDKHVPLLATQPFLHSMANRTLQAQCPKHTPRTTGFLGL